MKFLIINYKNRDTEFYDDIEILIENLHRFADKFKSANIESQVRALDIDFSIGFSINGDFCEVVRVS